MRLIGLTGGIAMGKSAIAHCFAANGVPTYSADDAVHDLYRREAVEPVRAGFPGAIVNGVVDRKALRAQLRSASDWQKLEAIVHPLVRKRESSFVDAMRAQGHRLCVLDIPLLFETEGAARVDIIILASASPVTQTARLLARPGMTAEAAAVLIARQMDDAAKRRRAHFIIDTNGPLEHMQRQVQGVLRAIRAG